MSKRKSDNPLEPGIWADHKPKEKPSNPEFFVVNRPYKSNRGPAEFQGLNYATGGPVGDKTIGFMMDSIPGDFMEQQKVGRSMRMPKPRTMNCDKNHPSNQQDRPVISNLCMEIEIGPTYKGQDMTLPPKKLSTQEHLDFIKRMMLLATEASTKDLYYGNPKPKEASPKPVQDAQSTTPENPRPDSP